MTHLFVGTPMYGGMCSGYYTQSVMALQLAMQSRGKLCTFSFMFNESLITRARNTIVKSFLSSGATHLIFIDADIRFDPQDVLWMLGADVDIICGIYPKKELNWGTLKDAVESGIPGEYLRYHTGAFVVEWMDSAGPPASRSNEPCEIKLAGTGFMMIKREVFETLKPFVPSYTSDHVGRAGEARTEVVHEFFATSIDESTNHLLSEDYHFCKLARRHGIKVHAAPAVQLGHVGAYLFEGHRRPPTPGS